jgi:threonine dehydrogenase-like Zn-dependent dehydrogenase
LGDAIPLSRSSTHADFLCAVHECRWLGDAGKEPLIYTHGIETHLKQFTIPLWACMSKEIVIRSALAYEEEDFAEVVRRFSEGEAVHKHKSTTSDLYSGRYKNLEAMVTARINLDDLVKEGFEQLINRANINHVKILVTPKPELLHRE